MKKILMIILIAVGILFIGISVCFFYNNHKTTLELEDSNKYIIITDSKWKTMLNDGGSNTNIFYEIYPDNNSVIKTTESYHANLGGTPKTDKKSITIKIDNELSKELSTTLSKIFQSDDKNNSNNYNFYTIEKQNEHKEIYNEDTIKILKELINKIESKS